MRVKYFRRFWLGAAPTAPVELWAQQAATAPTPHATTATAAHQGTTAPVPVEILMVDPSGMRVPLASVLIVPSPDDAGKKFKTDDKGRLELALKAGSNALLFQGGIQEGVATF